MKKLPITRSGYRNLMKELSRLKRVDRVQTMKDIEEARSHGDLTENAEYEAAKERQAFIERKIHDIESRLTHSEIIETKNLSTDRVVFGSVVLLENVDTGERVQYQLVGPDESDVKQGKISSHSPVGCALIGKEVNDEVSVRTPGGMRNFIVMRISSA
ncbi:MAG: transcription elongation factor GreA [Syntrophobacterales bacterium]|nr:MAG: transcription elongation factor GreA [Syntrophobacterales bacterium]